MSDLGNGGWPNSMKLGKDIDLDELLLNPVLFVFILSFFQLFRGSPLLGSKSTQKHPNFRVHLPKFTFHLGRNA